LTTTPGEENVSIHEISVKMRNYKLKEERMGVLYVRNLAGGKAITGTSHKAESIFVKCHEQSCGEGAI
jgi:hypothetical protein